MLSLAEIEFAEEKIHIMMESDKTICKALSKNYRETYQLYLATYKVCLKALNYCKKEVLKNESQTANK